MNNLDLTAHARKRMGQRGINELQLRLIAVFGQFDYQKGGGELAFIPENVLTDLRRAVDHLPNVGVIFSQSGRVVTTEHIHKKIRRTALSA